MAVVLLGFSGLSGLGYATAAHAQVGVYVGYQATGLSGITCFDPQNACSSANGKVNPAGIQAGVYYDFRNIGPMRLGLDFRGGTMHGNKSATSSAGGNDTTGLDNALVGVRGSFHTHISWLNPYVQVSGGYARSNATLPIYTGLVTTTPLPRTEDNFFMYEGFVGLTIHIFPMIDLRPVELGIGNMNRFGSSSTEDGPSSIGVKSIGASFVFHLPSSQ
ncbi:MAG: hypothetical protein WB439_10010 [Acidobacteriaceae bacterium]